MDLFACFYVFCGDQTKHAEKLRHVTKNGSLSHVITVLPYEGRSLQAKTSFSLEHSELFSDCPDLDFQAYLVTV